MIRGRELCTQVHVKYVRTEEESSARPLRAEIKYEREGHMWHATLAKVTVYICSNSFIDYCGLCNVQ